MQISHIVKRLSEERQPLRLLAPCMLALSGLTAKPGCKFQQLGHVYADYLFAARGFGGFALNNARADTTYHPITDGSCATVLWKNIVVSHDPMSPRPLAS